MQAVDVLRDDAAEQAAGQAEDVVQDAFLRALNRWDELCSYDSLEAWLRKVALGLLSNRRRKLRNAAKAVLRH